MSTTGDDTLLCEPVNLAKANQVGRLRIRLDAMVRRDLSSAHMIGQLVEIAEITRL